MGTGHGELIGYAPSLEIAPTPKLPLTLQLENFQGTLTLPIIVIPPSGRVSILFDGATLTDPALQWRLRVDYSGPDLAPPDALPFPIVATFPGGTRADGTPWHRGWRSPPLPPGSTLYASVMTSSPGFTTTVTVSAVDG